MGYKAGKTMRYICCAKHSYAHCIDCRGYYLNDYSNRNGVKEVKYGRLKLNCDVSNRWEFLVECPIDNSDLEYNG